MAEYFMDYRPDIRNIDLMNALKRQFKDVYQVSISDNHSKVLVKKNVLYVHSASVKQGEGETSLKTKPEVPFWYFGISLGFMAIAFAIAEFLRVQLNVGEDYWINQVLWIACIILFVGIPVTYIKKGWAELETSITDFVANATIEVDETIQLDEVQQKGDENQKAEKPFGIRAAAIFILVSSLYIFYIGYYFEKYLPTGFYDMLPKEVTISDLKYNVFIYAIIGLLVAYLIWSMRKWGAYLYFAFLLVSTFVLINLNAMLGVEGVITLLLIIYSVAIPLLSHFKKMK